jgi:hypothetical protein
MSSGEGLPEDILTYFVGAHPRNLPGSVMQLPHSLAG